jgi:hypothetical protein
MDDTDDAAVRIIPWDREGEYGVYIDYGAGSWRSYLVGSFDEAHREQARLILRSGVPVARRCLKT